MKIRKILPLLVIATCLAGCGNSDDAKFAAAFNVPNNLIAYDTDIAEYNLNIAATEITNIKSVYTKQTMETYESDILVKDQSNLKVERNAYVKYFDNNIIKSNEALYHEADQNIRALDVNISNYYYAEKDEGSDYYSIKNREVNEKNNYVSTTSILSATSKSAEYTLKNYMFSNLVTEFVNDFSDLFSDGDNMMGNDSMMYKIIRTTSFDNFENIKFPYAKPDSTTEDNKVPVKIDNNTVIKYKKDNNVWRLISYASSSDTYQLEDCYGNVLENPILVSNGKSISVIYYENNGGIELPVDTFKEHEIVTALFHSFTDDSHLDDQSLIDLTLVRRQETKNESEHYFQRIVTLNANYNYAIELSNKTQYFGYNNLVKGDDFDLYFSSSTSSACEAAFKVNYSGNYLVTVDYNYDNDNLEISVDRIY